MRITIRRVKGINYVYVHESYRDVVTGKPKHKTIRSYGRLDDRLAEDPKFLDDLEAKVTKANAEYDTFKKIKRFGASPHKTQCQMINYGELIFEKVFDELFDDPANPFADDPLFSYGTLARFIGLKEPLVQEFLSPGLWSPDRYIGQSVTLHEDDISQLLIALADHRTAITECINHRLNLRYPSRTPTYIADYYTLICRKQCSRECIPDDRFILSLVSDTNFVPMGYNKYRGKQTMASELAHTVGDYVDRVNADPLLICSDRGFQDPDVLVRLQSLNQYLLIGSRISNSTEGLKEKHLLDSKFIDVFEHDSDTLRYRYKTIAMTYDDAFPLKDFPDPILYYSPRLEVHDRLVRDPYLKDGLDLNFLFLRGGAGRNAPIEPMITSMADAGWTMSPKEFFGFRVLFCQKPDLTPEQISDLFTTYWTCQNYLTRLQSKMVSLVDLSWSPKLMDGACLLYVLGIALRTIIEHRIREANIVVNRDRLSQLMCDANLTIVEKDEQVFYLKTKTTPLYDQIACLFGMVPLKTVETPDSICEKLGILI